MVNSVDRRSFDHQANDAFSLEKSRCVLWEG